jgi:hypothetical protein
MELTMMNRNARIILGALTGAVGLVAMIRLVSGAFSGGVSALAWAFILLAMLPWVGYVAWRASRSPLSGRSAAAVLGFGLVGLLSVWLFTIGPVLALLCSLAAFVVIWVRDWPPRRSRSEERFVRIEELALEDSDPRG